MIRTKSVLEKKSEEDGIRICVMRFVRGWYDYDEWMRKLAPSAELLFDYRKGRIDWAEYRRRYLDEMAESRELIHWLKRRSESGEVITLLCWERDDSFCHRRLLKELIEECEQATRPVEVVCEVRK